MIYLGRFEEAQQVPGIEENAVASTLLLARSGQHGEARTHIDTVRDQMARPFEVAMLYAIVGDADEAFYWIDKGIEERYRGALLLGTWELFDPIRSDPRFDAALRRIGFTG